jgi:hypothetical protein
MITTLQAHLALLDGPLAAGWVYDSAAPQRCFVVEIMVDDEAVAVVRADAFSPALAARGMADPRHGFVQVLDASRLATARRITARLANLGDPVGASIDVDTAATTGDPLLTAPGAVETVTGLVISGWIGGPAGTASAAAPTGTALVCALVAGEEVAATIARIWTSRPIGGRQRPVLQFALTLPAVLGCDGPHTVTMVTAGGVPLAGATVVVG